MSGVPQRHLPPSRYAGTQDVHFRTNLAPDLSKTAIEKEEWRGKDSPLGTLRTYKGIVFVKVGPGKRREGWKRVHVINWEAANGALPGGFLLKCKDGNTKNTDASNWALMPKSLGPNARNAIHNTPADLVEAAILNETLKHELRAARARAGLPDPIAQRGIRKNQLDEQRRHAEKMKDDPVYREKHRQKVRRRYLTQKQNRAARMAVDPEYAAARRAIMRRKEARKKNRKKDADHG